MAKPFDNAAALSVPALSVNTNAVKPPAEAYKLLADKGADTVKRSSWFVFGQSFVAGCYIGFGALLAATIAGNVPGLTKENEGLKNLIFGALFPVNLLLILLTGGILFTGTSAACPAALYEGHISVKDAARCLAISWVGNAVGSGVFALFTQWCSLLEGPTKAIAIDILRKKVSKDFTTTLLKGIGCNWMVCMAVFLSGQAQDMTGKYVGIWFPISTFVMIGFEHIPANFYLLQIGLLAGESDITFMDVLVKNWIPVTLGNFVAGAFIVAGGYSFMFGRLGTRAMDKIAPKTKMQDQTKDNQTTDPVKSCQDLEAAGTTPSTASTIATGSTNFERTVSEDSLHGV